MNYKENTTKFHVYIVFYSDQRRRCKERKINEEEKDENETGGSRLLLTFPHQIQSRTSFKPLNLTLIESMS